jgi:hypothetical protein
MKKCTIDGEDDRWITPIYCPDWSNQHVMFSNWEKEKYTWFRLAVHKCDPERRALKGKTCASEDEINEYFNQYFFLMDVSK